MVRDSVVNMVDRLKDRGFDPRRVGADSWEARCPGHRSADHALAVTRDDLSHVALECRSVEHCHFSRIIRALGFTNDLVYQETPDWLVLAIPARSHRAVIVPLWGRPVRGEQRRG